MSMTLTWWDIGLRLLCTVAACAIIGLNRTEHGRPAGLRTTMLVGLAASIAMVLANLLMTTTGKAPNSFVNIDVMRLPLGILCGLGFIGGGAILHRQNLVLGVTTAATLWFVTVMGLCFGAGQIGLGWASVMLGFLVLWALKGIEKITKTEKRPVLTVISKGERLGDDAIVSDLTNEGFKIVASSIVYSKADQHIERSYQLHWHAYPDEVKPPAFLASIAARPDILKLTWRP